MECAWGSIWWVFLLCYVCAFPSIRGRKQVHPFVDSLGRRNALFIQLCLYHSMHGIVRTGRCCVGWLGVTGRRHENIGFSDFTLISSAFFCSRRSLLSPIGYNPCRFCRMYMHIGFVYKDPLLFLLWAQIGPCPACRHCTYKSERDQKFHCNGF